MTTTPPGFQPARSRIAPHGFARGGTPTRAEVLAKHEQRDRRILLQLHGVAPPKVHPLCGAIAVSSGEPCKMFVAAEGERCAFHQGKDVPAVRATIEEGSG